MEIFTSETGYIADKQAVFALGNFDGVHTGHVALLKRAVKFAKAQGVISAALIFSEHPENVMAKTCVSPYITTNEQKAQLIGELGVDRVIYIEFDEKTSTMSPDTFVRNLKERYGADSVVCGFHYRFGKNASGNAQDMRTLCEKYRLGCDIISPVIIDGLVVSSTAIRSLIVSGNMELCNRLLGRPFSIEAQVKEGRHFGKTIGFPTINQILPAEAALPAFGVYATKTLVYGTWHNSVTNIGVRPTVVEDGAYNIETHIMGIKNNLYGKNIKVEFYKRLREEQHFKDTETLRAAIDKNIEQAQSYLDHLK